MGLLVTTAVWPEKRLHSLKDIKGKTIEEVFFPGQYLGFMDS